VRWLKQLDEEKAKLRRKVADAGANEDGCGWGLMQHREKRIE